MPYLVSPSSMQGGGASARKADTVPPAWHAPLLLITVSSLQLLFLGCLKPSLLPRSSMGQNHGRNVYSIFVLITGVALQIFIDRRQSAQPPAVPGTVLHSTEASHILPEGPMLPRSFMEPESPFLPFHVQTRNIYWKSYNMLNFPRMKTPI